MIKSVRSLALVLAMVASPLPLTAQELKPIEPDGSLAKAIRREGVRLALAPQGGSADAEWSRVRTLQRGREIGRASCRERV